MNESSRVQEQRVSYGIFLPQIYPWEQMVRYALLIEELGFDTLWLADHFVSPYDSKADWFEGWTMLAALAARTTRIRLATGVSHIVYRNPAMLARAAMTVDHISNGRLELGLGVGGAGDYNYGMTGTPRPSTRERVDRYAEAVSLIDQLLRNETTDFQGDYYQVSGAVMRPGPVQKPRPPFNLAAHYPRSMKVAATYGDSWNSFYPGDDLTDEEGAEVTRERGVLLDQLAVEAGRDPNAIRRTFFVGYSADTPFTGGDALPEFDARYRKAGIQEFVLGFAPGVEELAGQWIMSEEQLRQTAHTLL